MLIPYLLLILMIALWGFSFVIVDIAVEFIPPLSLALYRLIIASISFLIIDLYLKLRQKNKDNKNFIDHGKNDFSRKEWILIAMASFSGISIYLSLLYTAIELIGPSIPALSDCLLAPVMVSVLALLFFREKLSGFKIIGFFIASIGIFFLSTGGNMNVLSVESPSFMGYIFILLTPVLWALYSTIIKKLEKSRFKAEFQILKLITYLACFELFVLVLIAGQIEVFITNFLNIILIFCAIYLGLFAFAIGFYIWNYSQKHLSSSKVASFLYIQPFLTLLFSIIFQRNETITIWNIIGGIIILFAVVIINYK